MPHYPKSRPVADIGYLANLLAEMEALARRQRRPLLAFLIGMARLEAPRKVGMRSALGSSGCVALSMRRPSE